LDMKSARPSSMAWHDPLGSRAPKWSATISV
jgi:hypothetical protein